MQINKLFLILVLFFIESNLNAAFGQANPALFDSDKSVTLLAGDFSFTEGPAADSEGNVYFTDQPNDKIWVWTIDGELQLFTDESGRSNGLYVDEQDRLVACADMDNQLWRFDSDGEAEILLENYENNRLNGPNDLWIRPDGKIYFTDPLYARNYWTRDPEMQVGGQFVYFFDPEGRAQAVPVDTDIVKPNGLIGNPKTKTLYVADIGDGKTYSYKMKKNGKLKKRKLFTGMGSDGMTIDERGNIYLTGDGVTIFNPDGEKIGHIPVPERWTANVTFGGADRNILYITASRGLYALEMNVRGMPRF